MCVTVVDACLFVRCCLLGFPWTYISVIPKHSSSENKSDLTLDTHQIHLLEPSDSLGSTGLLLGHQAAVAQRSYPLLSWDDLVALSGVGAPLSRIQHLPIS